jgi:zeaxanthin glucosyltransferase
MTHFGILCPATKGHLNPMTALGWTLQQRGHQVTLFGIPDARSAAQSAGLEFRAIGESNFSPIAMKRIFEEQGKRNGMDAVRYVVTWMKDLTATVLREAPAAIQEAGVEALLVDQVSPEGGSIADILHIPYISFANALMSYRDNSIPPGNTSWNYSSAAWAKCRNFLGYTALEKIVQPVIKEIIEYRRDRQLPAYRSNKDLYSKLALISQQVSAFEFPRHHLPPHIHFTGPLYSPQSRPSIDFPFEQLNGKPLIYASLGTLQNRLQSVFQDIAQACVGLDVQLVISLGSGISTEALPDLPGSPIVAPYVPQLELLQKANLVITHAGLNTTLESLSCGVPLVAIPISLDQPGIAARIAWTGTGEIVPLSRLSPSKLRETITQVLTHESYKMNAVRLQQALHDAGGVSRAVDIIEEVISSANPKSNWL